MDISRMTVAELNEKLNRGEKVALVDARSPQAWNEARTRVPGAVRVPPDEAEKHLANVGRDRTVVVYCS
jgi:rhodanese-related sulfurtransferase